MDLGTYLLDGVVAATTPSNETAAAAQIRREAILQMVQAYDPSNAMEGMMACHCVMLQMILNGAVHDASNTTMTADGSAKARAGAMSISRTLLQWVRKLEHTKKRNEVRATEAQEQAETETAPVAVAKPAAADRRPPVTPPYQPMPMPAERSNPPPNARAQAAVAPPVTGLSPPNGSQPPVLGQAVAEAAVERALAT
jgi:hypothetical protein